MIGLQYMNMCDNRSQAILIIVPERFLRTLYGLIQNVYNYKFIDIILHYRSN